MKNVLILTIALFLIFSCKPCRECKYSTFKDTIIKRSCSSIKADRIAFEQKMDSIAKSQGSTIKCTKETY